MKSDGTEELYAKKLLGLQIMHVPTGKIVEFKAFLTQFSDTYNSSWNAESVYGRMDPIATFQGTTREIAVGWSVPAFSNAEAKLNLEKASLFFSMLYPAYSPSSGVGGAGQISASPLLKIKFANLICSVTKGQGKNIKGVREGGLLGFINGAVSLTPDFEGAGFYDPGFGEVYPLLFNLSFAFTVLHTHKLGWEAGASRSRLTETNAAGTPQFPYGSPYPPAGASKINKLGASDASPLPNAHAPMTDEELAVSSTVEDFSDNPQQTMADLPSGETDPETGKNISLGQAGPNMSLPDGEIAQSLMSQMTEGALSK